MPKPKFWPEKDLWGDPVPEPTEKRGQPPHQATDEKRLRVAVLRALNQSHDEIAEALGISKPTLRKHYFSELRDGFAQKRAEVMVRLWKSVEAGNVAAMKEFIRQVDKSDVTPVRAAPPKPVKIGKKEQARLDAETPDTTSSMGELMSRRMGEDSIH